MKETRFSEYFFGVDNEFLSVEPHDFEYLVEHCSRVLSQACYDLVYSEYFDVYLIKHTSNMNNSCGKFQVKLVDEATAKKIIEIADDDENESAYSLMQSIYVEDEF